MSSENSRNAAGVSRIHAKLKSALEENNYYEAHQLYKALYFRYVKQKKYDECLNLLFDGCETFLNKEEFSSGVDLCLSIIDTLEKAKKEIDTELWMKKLGILFAKINPRNVERETIIVKAVKWSAGISGNNLGHPLMHAEIAKVLLLEGNIEQGRYHLLLSCDGYKCGNYLIELSQTKGYSNEIDLFIAQAVLQELCLKDIDTALKTFETYTKYHPKIGKTQPPFNTPLLNFLFFLLEIIRTKRQISFKPLCDLYKPTTNRDPSYEKYLQKIGTLYFGIAPPSQQQFGMGGLIGNLFNSLLQEIDDDEDDDRSSSNVAGNKRNIVDLD